MINELKDNRVLCLLCLIDFDTLLTYFSVGSSHCIYHRMSNIKRIHQPYSTNYIRQNWIWFVICIQNELESPWNRSNYNIWSKKKLCFLLVNLSVDCVPTWQGHFCYIYNFPWEWHVYLISRLRELLIRNLNST